MPFYGGCPCKGKKNMSFREKIFTFWESRLCEASGAGKYAMRQEINNPRSGPVYRG